MRRESSCKQSSSPISTMPLQIRRGFHLVAHQVLARKHEELTYRAKVGADGHLLVGMATTAMLNLKPEGESPSSCLRRRDSPLSRLVQKTRSEQGKRPHQRVLSHSTNNRQTSFSSVLFSLIEAVQGEGNGRPPKATIWKSG